MGQVMIRHRTALIVCCLAGTAVFSSDCFAKPQDEQPTAEPQEAHDKSESSSRDGAIPSVPVDSGLRSVDRENRVGLPLLKNIVGDQTAVLTGTRHLHFADADWLLPLGGATAALLATDTEYSKHLS